MQTALLIIDVQQGLCEGNEAAFDSKLVIERINQVARRLGWAIFVNPNILGMLVLLGFTRSCAPPSPPTYGLDERWKYLRHCEQFYREAIQRVISMDVNGLLRWWSLARNDGGACH